MSYLQDCDLPKSLDHASLTYSFALGLTMCLTPASLDIWRVMYGSSSGQAKWHKAVVTGRSEGSQLHWTLERTVLGVARTLHPHFMTFTGGRADEMKKMTRLLQKQF